MKITLVQPYISWADPASNRGNLSQLLAGVGQTDLVVLPEMFSTGFAPNPEGIAEEAPSQTLEWMKAKSREMDCAIAGSISLSEEGSFHNRFYFVKPDGQVEWYDKHHLFTYSGEDLIFKAGEERRVVEWRGVRYLLIVCYDLRFPVWSRNRDDYDAILCVASWPDVRRVAWEILLRARAIENQCFVAGVNRVGTDPACNYSGGTAFIDPYGGVLACCANNTQEAVTCEFDLEHLVAFKNKFPVLRDADKFALEPASK